MILREEYFTMSDGVRLYTRIVLPDENGKFPIVFVRTPYSEARNGEPYPIEKYKDNLYIKNGYAIVYQHTRGRGDSEGICKPHDERNDGLDTLEIIRTLPFYNGEIYLVGGSYLAMVHLCYLNTSPKDVKAAALSIQGDRMYDRNYLNGCCFKFCNPDWWLSMLKNRYPEQKPLTEVLYRPYYKLMERAVGEDVPEFTALMLNDENNDFWKNDPRVNVSETLEIPTLLIEGWYDFYVKAMFSMWDRLQEETRKRSALVVGPWGHALEVSKDAEYPLENGNLPQDYIVKFFNSVRDNTPYEELELGKVNYYSIGKDCWTIGKPHTQNLKLYFNNDSTLAKESLCVGQQSYSYDPDKPLNYFKHQNIFKAEEMGSCNGVLSFISAPFEEEVDFYGKIEWNMKVKTDCDDTAFFMRVYMVENGTAYNLTQTITALSYINQDYAAGEECKINISTPPIGFTIKKGNSIRVDISSHSGIYAPHSNTKGHWAKVTEAKVANNTVICDEDAYISLPVK